MERSKAYLANIIFTIFYKYRGDSEKVAEAVSGAIRGALYDMFPKGRKSDMYKYDRIEFGKKFLSTLIIKLQELCDEVDCKDDLT